MAKSISVALGEPYLYTNALANVHLPFVVEWDDMSEEGQAEMIKEWSPAEVGRRSFADKTRLFSAEYDNVRLEWHSKGGETARDLGVGIHDEANALVRLEWRSKGGETARDPGVGAPGMRQEQSRTFCQKMILFLDMVCLFELFLLLGYELFLTNILLRTNTQISQINMS